MKFNYTEAIVLAMSEEARALKAAYLRNWRKAHPDRARAHEEAYWEKKVARMAAQEAERTEPTATEGTHND